MIGMPRITFTTAFAVPARSGTPETRISAQTRPSAVDSASEPTVTMTVSRRPCIRIGRNSADCLRKASMKGLRARDPPHPEARAEGEPRRTHDADAASCRRRVLRGSALRASHLSMRRAGSGPRASVLQAPFRQDLLERAVGLDLGERGVDFLQQFLVRFAHADADRADDHRLFARDEPDLREASLLEVVGDDRVIGEAGLETPGV